MKLKTQKKLFRGVVYKNMVLQEYGTPISKNIELYR